MAADTASSHPAFLNVLVTPKLCFSLPSKPHWRSVEDISQQDLRKAFLSRFPVPFNADRICFRCATPSLELDKANGCVVYKICAEDTQEERVLLLILSEIDKEYTAKYEQQLERARADCAAASVGFQVVADEVRLAQQTAELKWGQEVKSLRDVQSTNQKRLFLLEQERDQLRDQLHRAINASGSMRAGLREENDALREEMRDLRQQVMLLQASVAATRGADVAAEAHSAATQTEGEPEAARRNAEHWQQQLSAVSEWLKTGAALLQNAEAG